MATDVVTSKSVTPVSARAHLKRKRAAEISYYESSGESGLEDSDAEGYDTPSDDDDFPATGDVVARKTTPVSKPLPPRKVFPFEKLPPELKNQIYDFALVDHNNVNLSLTMRAFRRSVHRTGPIISVPYGYSRRFYTQRSLPQTAPKPAGLVPNLLSLSRQIHSETQPMLYGANKFVLEDTGVLHTFLCHIGPKNRGTLTDITLKNWGNARSLKTLNFPAMTMLSDAVNLRVLHLDCSMGWHQDSKRVAVQFYREAFLWLEAMSSIKGSIDAAMDIVKVGEQNLGIYESRWSREHKKCSLAEKTVEFRQELVRLSR